jgi:hypothetical protein
MTTTTSTSTPSTGRHAAPSPAYAGPEYVGTDVAEAATFVFPAVAPAPRRGSRGRTIAIALGATLAGAGIAAGVLFGIGATASTPSTPTPPSTVVVNGGGTHHVTPAVPSAAIETLQRELGRLDYYEGPVTGIMNTQTTLAITYLQRDAHLPQTGQVNAATRTSLAVFLAHGNNQMGN